MMNTTTLRLFKIVLPLLGLFILAGFLTVQAQPFQGGRDMDDKEFKKNISEFQKGMQAKMQAQMRQKQRRKMQDNLSGIPASVLKLQSLDPIPIVSIPDAIAIALKEAQKAAAPLIDTSFHQQGKKIIVPDDYKMIQEAIGAARAGDVVIVKPGIYYEQLVMKDGVKLVSDSSESGDELVSVPGARIQLPKRTLRTIIDGSNTKPSKHGMIDFDPGLGRKTIIDGFTIQNLPLQNHHIPGHAHGLNVRGASPVVTNCFIRNMGSTGIGSHVVYHDQASRIPNRDFRWDNVKHQASAVLYNNIITESVGLGIGCNHFSSPFILGNEVFKNNDDVLGEEPTPGMGNKHGSFATIIGNIVHDNPGGGILAKGGIHQGKYGIDRPTHPTLSYNVVYDNGANKPGISCQKAGSKEAPVIFRSNYVFRSASVGIGLSKGSLGIVEDNYVLHSAKPNIAINGSELLKLNRNKIIGLGKSPGITIVNNSVVHEMIGNDVENGETPRFMVDKTSEVKEVVTKK